LPEPSQLKRGKKFQEIVQKDFMNHTVNSKAWKEERISFEGLEHIKQKSGRMDILITGLGDFVTILEIKATDWDRIKSKNVKRNLYRHQKQLFNYVDKYLDIDKLDVCLGIIYPKPPRKKGLRKFIESYLEENYCVPPYWFNEIRFTG
jgi:hypothetical protein